MSVLKATFIALAAGTGIEKSKRENAYVAYMSGASYALHAVNGFETWKELGGDSDIIPVAKGFGENQVFEFIEKEVGDDVKELYEMAGGEFITRMLLYIGLAFELEKGVQMDAELVIFAIAGADAVLTILTAHDESFKPHLEQLKKEWDNIKEDINEAFDKETEE